MWAKAFADTFQALPDYMPITWHDMTKSLNNRPSWRSLANTDICPSKLVL